MHCLARAEDLAHLVVLLNVFAPEVGAVLLVVSGLVARRHALRAEVGVGVVAGPVG